MSLGFISSSLSTSKGFPSTPTVHSAIDQHEGNFMKVISIVYLFVILVLSVTSNVSSLTAIIKSGLFRKKLHTLFIINLFVADLGIGAFSVGFTLLNLLEKQVFQSSFLCKLNGFLAVIFPAVNVQTVALIAFHRYLLVVHPHHSVITKKRAISAIVVTWSVSLSLATFPLTGILSHIEYNDRLHHCVPDFRSPCFYGYVCLTAYVVTVPVSIFCYASIGRKLSAMAHTIKVTKARSQQSTTGGTETRATGPTSSSLTVEDDYISGTTSMSVIGTDIPSRKRRQEKKRRRAIVKLAADKRVAMASGLIILTTVVCWTPFAAANVCFFKEQSTSFQMAVTLLAYTNATLDPVIYVCFNRDIAKRIWRLYDCLKAKELYLMKK